MGKMQIVSIVSIFVFLTLISISSGKIVILQPSLEKRKESDYGLPSSKIQDNTWLKCEDYKDEGFECVTYYQCKNGRVVYNEDGLLRLQPDIQLDPASSKCPGELEVCCRLPNNNTSTKLINPEHELDFRNIEEPSVNRMPYKPGCGQRNVDGVSVKITNLSDNSSSQFGEWPHVCAIVSHPGNQYVCGCSIIADKVVLTAAHCVDKLTALDIKIRGGEWDTQHINEPFETQDVFVKQITVHPLFDPFIVFNDVALIHLAQPFILAPHIDTVCLPNRIPNNDFIGKNCFASGWGKDKFGQDGNYQVIMKEVQLDLVGFHDCEAKFRETRLGNKFDLHKSFICAGGRENQDTCKGDGGGPLVCQLEPRRKDIRYVQVGIVSWGIGCGTTTPGAYSNVSDAACFIDWATRCVEGQNASFYGYLGCEKWALEEYCKIKKKLDSTHDSKLNESDIEDLKDEELRVRNAIQNCQTGPKDLDCSSLDSDHPQDVLKNETLINNVPRSIFIEELDYD